MDRAKIERIKKKVANPEMYSSFHIRIGAISGRWYLGERSYPGMEVMWYDHEYLTEEEVVYLVEKRIVPVWFAFKEDFEKIGKET